MISTQEREKEVSAVLAGLTSISLEGEHLEQEQRALHLLPDDEKPERYRGTNVVVWGRVSSSFGQQIDSAYYDLVQVIDGDGAKTAAFDDWVAYCESDVTGGNPGEMHYRQVKEGFRG